MRAISTLLPLFVLAAALSACGGGGGDEQTARVVERLLNLGQMPDTSVRALVAELPDGLPEGIPEYEGSRVIASFVIESPDQDSYLALYDSAGATADILAYFEEALDEDPWQVVSATSSAEFVALQFSKVDDANVTGSVGVTRLEEDGVSSIALSVQVVLQEARSDEDEPFELAASRPLPSVLPSEIVAYPDSTVTESAWLRTSTGLEIVVTLVTSDGEADVIDFYSDELEDAGWTVFDEGSSGLSRVLTFSDEAGEIDGSIVLDRFVEDESLTQVDIQVTVSAN